MTFSSGGGYHVFIKQNLREDAMEEEMKNGKKSVAPVVAAGVIGVAAGAALGILFAPKPGKETRAMLAAKAKELNEKGKETAEMIASRAKALGESGRETAEMVAHKARTSVSSKNR
jgi:gas vesicle protein